MKSLILSLIFFVLLSKSAYTEDQSLVYRLPIFSNINSTAWVYTQKAFKEADEYKADAIILHLNTYGGEVLFADSIRTKILNSEIPVHVFIDNNAASAGALISIAAKTIHMRPGANIGAATVVDGTGGEMPDKYQSYMRSTIRSTAEAHGKKTIVENGTEKEVWIRDPKIAEAMVDQRVVVDGWVDSTQVLTLTTNEAIKLGFCEGTAHSVRDVADLLGYKNAEIVSFTPSFYDNLVGFLTNPMLQGILILVILGGLYFEMQSPGIGFPLIAALMAGVLYFAPLYIDGLASSWEILIFLIGIGLIAAEIFVFPGFGVAGISGIILAITGLTLSNVSNDMFDFSNVETGEFTKSLLIVIGGMAGGLVAALYTSNKMLKATKGPFSKIALNTSQDIDKGYISFDNKGSSLVGEIAITHTVLRPSGKVMLDNEVYDARAIEGFIDKGEKVKIIRYSSGQLNVRKIL
ncbi:NfeD family protein [Marinilabiliaceae bacterium ANBcel2]|nr:NfeD family protein [Marinilabiliaceae bacterium ANBcel2]